MNTRCFLMLLVLKFADIVRLVIALLLHAQ